ncbi:hypothetical protein DASC09_043850 [Saccharomycopsis crataegensis]|uniref:Uncharacterized protein n=1 Tax=Saccharomycopsis crataegensis TaxID=43959 RepID=A0AAV5QQ41_9ASCO|nr:hypothetical protein DASC09_043850 [Saccharomycopsis crataegensis]
MADLSKLDQFYGQLKTLMKENSSLKSKLSDQETQYKRTISNLEFSHLSKLQTLESDHRTIVDQMERDYQEKLVEFESDYLERIRAIDESKMELQFKQFATEKQVVELEIKLRAAENSAGLDIDEVTSKAEELKTKMKEYAALSFERFEKFLGDLEELGNDKKVPKVNSETPQKSANPPRISGINIPLINRGSNNSFEIPNNKNISQSPPRPVAKLTIPIFRSSPAKDADGDEELEDDGVQVVSHSQTKREENVTIVLTDGEEDDNEGKKEEKGTPNPKMDQQQYSQKNGFAKSSLEEKNIDVEATMDVNDGTESHNIDENITEALVQDEMENVPERAVENSTDNSSESPVTENRNESLVDGDSEPQYQPYNTEAVEATDKMEIGENNKDIEPNEQAQIDGDGDVEIKDNTSGEQQQVAASQDLNQKEEEKEKEDYERGSAKASQDLSKSDIAIDDQVIRSSVSQEKEHESQIPSNQQGLILRSAVNTPLSSPAKANSGNEEDVNMTTTNGNDTGAQNGGIQKSETEFKDTIDESVASESFNQTSTPARIGKELSRIDDTDITADSIKKRRKKNPKKNLGASNSVTVKIINHHTNSRNFYKVKNTVTFYKIMRIIGKKFGYPIEKVRFYRTDGEIIIPTLTPLRMGWEGEGEIVVKFLENDLDEMEGRFMGASDYPE